jgi:hypothetical protein
MIAISPRVPFTIFGFGFIFMALRPLTPMTLRHGTARPRRRGVEPLILEGPPVFFYTVGGIFGRKGIGGSLILSKRTSCRWKLSCTTKHSVARRASVFLPCFHFAFTLLSTQLAGSSWLRLKLQSWVTSGPSFGAS